MKKYLIFIFVAAIYCHADILTYSEAADANYNASQAKHIAEENSKKIGSINKSLSQHRTILDNMANKIDSLTVKIDEQNAIIKDLIEQLNKKNTKRR